MGVIKFEGELGQIKNKPMSDKQKRYIESFLLNRKIDFRYKQMVSKAIQGELISKQASTIIDFLGSFVDFQTMIYPIVKSFGNTGQIVSFGPEVSTGISTV